MGKWIIYGVNCIRRIKKWLIYVVSVSVNESFCLVTDTSCIRNLVKISVHGYIKVSISNYEFCHNEYSPVYRVGAKQQSAQYNEVNNNIPGIGIKTRLYMNFRYFDLKNHIQPQMIQINLQIFDQLLLDASIPAEFSICCYCQYK